MVLESFGLRLKDAREAMGLTQKALAILANTTEATISRYESEVHEPSRKMIQNLAEILHVNPAWLLGANVDRWRDDAALPQGDTRRLPVLQDIGGPVESFEFLAPVLDIDFCVEKKTDNMAGARILPGDILFVRRQDTVESGHVALVQIDDQVLIRRVHHSGGAMILTTEKLDGPNEPVIVRPREVSILGRVVMFRSVVI
jgi:repressor LexA